MRIKNTEVYGLENSIKRSGMPMRVGEPTIDFITSNSKSDLKRAENLANTPLGSGHNNYLKGIIVQADIQYAQYFTPQLQRYNFVDIISSQSKMHRLTSLDTIEGYCNKYVEKQIISIVDILIQDYNEKPNKDKFMKVISNLPMGYELWMGITTNYLQLKTIYNQRKNHKLEDWKQFCNWIEKLPMSNLITGK